MKLIVKKKLLVDKTQKQLMPRKMGFTEIVGEISKRMVAKVRQDCLDKK